jgi:hypothetical protein
MGGANPVISRARALRSFMWTTYLDSEANSNLAHGGRAELGRPATWHDLELIILPGRVTGSRR